MDEQLEQPKEKRTTFILVNPPEVETKFTKDGAEIVSFSEFVIFKMEINDIRKGQWFVFTEVDKTNDKPMYNISFYEDGTFLFLCVKNNHDGESLEVTTLYDINQQEANTLVERLTYLLENYEEV